LERSSSKKPDVQENPTGSEYVSIASMSSATTGRRPIEAWKDIIAHCERQTLIEIQRDDYSEES
jgi:hypothetical protein